MKIITYTLKNGEKTSGKFYSDLYLFTNEVLHKANDLIDSEITDFRNFVASNRIEKIRTKEEYLFEFLMIGVFERQYTISATKTGSFSQNILQYLVNLREKNKKIKKYVDYLRGILSTVLLYRHLKSAANYFESSRNNFSLLIKWLSATGEFKEEVKRLLLWQNYFEHLREEQSLTIINEAIKFAWWFELESEQALGKYTVNVRQFLSNELRSHLWKEDIVFCARDRAEYHMNIVGSEIMNRAFRTEFMDAEKRAVLLPACMRSLPDNLCRAERRGLDYICTGCTSNCRVHQINMMGIKENFKVYIIPHSSDFSQWLKERGVNSGVGTVGVACINNLISGGLELKSLDIPAQCVLLDYCGCNNHWDKKGFSTDINISRLQEIMKQEVEEKIN